MLARNIARLPEFTKACGVFGHKAHRAVSSYQDCLGYPVTGHLTEFEKTVLLNSCHRVIVGPEYADGQTRDEFQEQCLQFYLAQLEATLELSPESIGGLNFDWKQLPADFELQEGQPARAK
ncbi:MAG: hypothetical protein GY947_05055 [Rhodobacteraceae bacterium]|nr:hypothetical protein [Paracoccaceae bacterium]